MEMCVSTLPPDGVVAAVAPMDSDSLSELQKSDPELSLVFECLETGVLPGG